MKDIKNAFELGYLYGQNQFEQGHSVNIEDEFEIAGCLDEEGMDADKSNIRSFIDGFNTGFDEANMDAIYAGNGNGIYTNDDET